MPKVFENGKRYKVTEEGIGNTMERIGLPREFANVLEDIFNLEFVVEEANIIDNGIGYDIDGHLFHREWVIEI